MHSATLPNSFPSHQLALEALRTAHVTEAVKGVLLCASYFVVAQLGVATSFDGAIYLIGTALFLPQWRPYLLLMAFSVHDARGQVVPFDYAAVTGISALMLLSTALHLGSTELTPGLIQFRKLAAAGLFLVVYGIISSAVNHNLLLHEQAPHRPFLVVGVLMLLMIVTAYIAHRDMYLDLFGATRLQTVVTCILLHTFLIGLLQLKYGPMFGASLQGMAEMIQQDQAINPGARGFARLTGPFLSPNALASIPAMLMLMLLRARRSTEISITYIVTFFLVGMLASALGGARTMFVFYVLAAAAMTWTRSPVKTIFASILCLPLLLLVDTSFSDVLTVMRLSNLNSLGSRGQLWQSTLESMGTTEWIFGMGLTHFPMLFLRDLGYGATDPHMWLLSMAGMFGILGIFIYIAVCGRVLIWSLRGAAAQKAMGVALFLFLFCREMGNTQYLFNHHPMCCLYWITLGFVFVRPGEFFDPALADGEGRA